MPIENGKINWWALSAIVMPIIAVIIGYGLSEVRNSDKELLRTMINQTSSNMEKYMSEQRELYKEFKILNEKQDIQIAELKDSIKTLCWAVSMPFEKRTKLFDMPRLDQFNRKGGQ